MANANILVIRYSQALFESAREGNMLDKIESELVSLNSAISEGGIVSRLLLNSSVPSRIKKPLLSNAIKALKLNQLTQSFLNQLLKNNRINLLAAIVKTFKELVLAEQGVVSAELKTATDLDKKTLDIIQKELEKSLSKSVQLNVITEKNLLGGFSITVGSKKIDCTLKNKLNKLRQQLVAVEF